MTFAVVCAMLYVSVGSKKGLPFEFKIFAKQTTVTAVVCLFFEEVQRQPEGLFFSVETKKELSDIFHKLRPPFLDIEGHEPLFLEPT